ncbi:PhzF family phenazine biosynthesis protein [Actinoplanes solisilvae]|uniref:PhzF family phenazine biosynthesis protein n=1 Tax=Actinoplanes solisilvae TaxID=2486853 RepID=UPI000FD7779A|nr:PhzF family phenazine biosynthesis protein [Actinoplanes solisilvae]
MTRVYVVDAFTDVPFRGNPAGVVLLDRWRDDEWLQQVAAEMRHSETAFAVPRADDGEWDLRWFTPAAEVDLCGHATLATAHVLARPAVFHTRSGRLSCDHAADGWIELNFPADPATPLTPDPHLRQALAGAEIVAAGRGVSDILVEVPDVAAVRALTPDLAAVAGLDGRGLIVTTFDNRAYSRCFYPALGVPEDPVTGSAHCTIASWWQARLGITEFVAEQLSARTGVLRIRHEGARVRLSGQAVTVWRGETAV